MRSDSNAVQSAGAGAGAESKRRDPVESRCKVVASRYNVMVVVIVVLSVMRRMRWWKDTRYERRQDGKK